ncbi:hypothetical protein ACFZCG_39270 [Streptomyces tanashiensis]|uniref:DUF7224 domain-containing protein n=1 Tax=Streptomyces tanashiensis TaxID=67367 RepID=UPI0036EA8561
MLLRTLVRSSSASVLLPLLVGFVLLALGDDLSAWVTPHYWPSATGSAAFAQPFVSAACAAAAAWEGARLTKGRVFEQASVRGPVGITIPVLAPVLAMGVAGVLVALFTSAVAADVPLGLPHFGILAAIVAMLVANTLVGYIIGRVLPGVLAAPLALIGSFFVTAYPASWSVFWLRYLVGGGLSGCCSVDTSVDSRALAATIIFAAAVSAAALTLIYYRGRAVPLCMAAVLVGTGFGIAWSVARDLGPEPVQERATAGLICDSTSQPEVCLWPEVEDPETVRREARAAATRLTRAGVKLPQTLTMAARPGPDALKLGIGPTAAREGAVAGGVASGLLPEPPPCALDGAPYPAAPAAGPIAAWLYVTAGVPAETVAGRFGPQEGALAQRVTKLPADEQLAWYERNRKALGSCNTPAPLSIAGITK